MISANDKPRAEVIVDVQILEVNRERAKQYGLNLSDYAIGGIFSPEVAPGTGDAANAASGAGHAVQPQHHLAGRQHRRLLPVGAGRGDALPRERLVDQDARQAAAARRRRARRYR